MGSRWSGWGIIGRERREEGKKRKKMKKRNRNKIILIK